MKKPLIGITAGINQEGQYLTIYRQFMDALLDAGAMPVLLPLTDDEAALADYVHRLDGFIFSGGGDMDPLLYGQLQKPSCGAINPMRDAAELALARLLLTADKPVLGICRGFQVLNVALGGDLYQDLPSEYDGELIAHRQEQPDSYPSHPVTVKRGTRLAAIVGEMLTVNSLHHQAVRRLGAWSVCAQSPDGVIEAAEAGDHPFMLGVQWHPERLWRADAASSALFRAFVQACQAEIV